MFIIIATIAPTAIGEPIKYCKNCGALALRPAGINNNPIVNIKGTPIIYNSLSEKSRFLTTLNPLSRIIIHTTAKTPPITAAGIELIIAESFPKNDRTINQPDATTKTFLLATPVIDIIPAFVE